MSKAEFARTYVNIEWDKFNDKYVRDGNVAGDRGILTMYNDDYFKTHSWLWDGKPHWAYHTKFMNLVESREAIEWTPNTIQSTVTINGDLANVQLISTTPNLHTYQMRKLPAGKWEDIAGEVAIPLNRAENTFEFRTVNTASVAGPLHRVVFNYLSAHQQD